MFVQGSQIVPGGGVKHTARKRRPMGRHAEESSRVLPPRSKGAAQAKSLLSTHTYEPKQLGPVFCFVLSLYSGVSVYIPWDALQVRLSSKHAIHV